MLIVCVDLVDLLVHVRKCVVLCACAANAVLLVDDLLATVRITQRCNCQVCCGLMCIFIRALMSRVQGGTLEAAKKLVEQLGGVVVGCACLVELTALSGRKLLEDQGVPVVCVMKV